MRKDTRRITGKSSELLWETLEQTIRGKVQEFIQEILEEEVTDFLGGRRKSQRRSSAEGGPKGYRNGYGKPRNLTLASGTVEVRRPRVRDVEERFESRVLPLFERRTKESAELVVQLYLHGLAEGDFELALRGLLGDGAPLSKSTVRRLREKWIAEHAEWECRSLADREIVYAWADGIYVKAGLEKDKAALLVIIGAMADGTKEVLAVASGFRESAESWAGVLRGLGARGARRAEAAGGRRQPGHLGGGEAGVARGGGAAVLEPQDGQRARPFAEAGAEAGEGAAAGDRVRGVEGGGAAAHIGRQAVQEGRGRDGPDLEAPHGGREAVPKAQRSPSAARCAPWRPLGGRPAGPGGGGSARGLTIVPQLRSGPGRRRSGRTGRPPAFPRDSGLPKTPENLRHRGWGPSGP